MKSSHHKRPPVTMKSFSCVSLPNNFHFRVIIEYIATPVRPATAMFAPLLLIALNCNRKKHMKFMNNNAETVFMGVFNMFNDFSTIFSNILHWIKSIYISQRTRIGQFVAIYATGNCTTIQCLLSDKILVTCNDFPTS